MIAHNFLEIKIAIPLQKNGLPEQLNKHKLFHEKTGIFTDREGNKGAEIWRIWTAHNIIEQFWKILKSVLKIAEMKLL